MSILEKILETKRQEVAYAKTNCPIESLKDKASSTLSLSLQEHLKQAQFPAIIAEVKRASPSKGLIRPDLNPVETAIAYAKNGATGISVLTDSTYFQGDLSFLSQIRGQVKTTPLLRKDFVIDSYQLWEAKAAGADAILLIVRALSEAQLTDFFEEASLIGLDCLVETHDKIEAEALCRLIHRQIDKGSSRLPICGINNRNLDTFVTSLETTNEVASYIRAELYSRLEQKEKINDLVIVSESGIFSGNDIAKLHAQGAKAFLIGESLVAQGDPGQNIERLINQARQAVEKK